MTSVKLTKRRQLLQLCMLLAAATPGFGQCRPVRGQVIKAGDLAPVDPLLALLPSETFVAFAPTPGVRRVLTARETDLVARSSGMAFANVGSRPDEICFEVPVTAIDEAGIRAAMLSSLPVGAQLDITELPKELAPDGEIRFPLSGLEPPRPGLAQVWRGYVEYAGSRRSVLTARVRVTTEVQSIVTLVDLPASEPIPASALRILSNETSNPADFTRTPVDLVIEHYAGRAPGIRIHAGSAVQLSQLSEPPLVRQGDVVRIEVRSGPARLVFSGIAQQSGRRDALSLFRNPDSGKLFRARVQSPSLATVVVKGAGETGSREFEGL